MRGPTLRSRLRRLPIVVYRRWETTVVFPARRRRLAGRVDTLEPGAVTVVTVNWNTLPYLQTMCEMVRRHSPSGTRIVVVDNASDDGSREWLRRRGDLESVLLRANIRHGPAADLGVTRVQTEFFVLLDVDAFPFSDRWLPEVLDALRAGASVAGGHVHRNYVHPSFLAMRTADFAQRGHSFSVVGKWRKGVKGGGEGYRDAGEEISVRERARAGESATYLIPVTEKRGPGMLGTVFGDLVYHNFFSTGYGPSKDWTDRTEGAWADAVARWVDDPAS